MYSTVKKFFQFLFLLFLISCNSDDPVGDDETVNPEVLHGVFVDSPVQGLYFSTPTQSGVTDAQGTFSYLEGETVKFYLGNLELGSALGANQITPIEIADDPNADLNSIEVQNRAALLQSLDSDRNPENGISISEESNSFMPNSINFSNPIHSTLAHLILEINLQTEQNLVVVYPNEAAENLGNYIGQSYISTDNTFTYLIRSMEGWHPIAQNSLVWIHTLNEEGKLSTSEMWEKYPLRLKRKHIYFDYNEDGMPLKYQQEQFDNNNEMISNHTFQIVYNEENRVAELWRFDENNQFIYHAKMLEWHDNNKVFKSQDINEDGSLGFIETFEIDEIGNTIRKTRYDSTGNNILRIVEYTYNANLDYAVGFSQYRYSDFQKDITDTYTYRSDGTLDKVVKEVKDINTDEVETQTIYYDENENVIE